MAHSKALLIAAAASSLLSYVTSAEAHAKLVSSAPAANATLPGPTRLELHFDDKLVDRGSSIQLFVTARGKTTLSPPVNVAIVATLAADGRTLAAPIVRPLTAGTYLVAWHAVTADGARTNGSFSFVVR